MNFFLLSLVSFILVVGLIVAAAVLTTKDEYTDAKDPITCGTTLDKSKKTCGVWDPSVKTCRKGTCKNCNGFDCTSKGDPIPLILFISACVAFVAFIVFLILGFVYKPNQTARTQFSYDSLVSNSSD